MPKVKPVIYLVVYWWEAELFPYIEAFSNKKEALKSLNKIKKQGYSKYYLRTAPYSSKKKEFISGINRHLDDPSRGRNE